MKLSSFLTTGLAIAAGLALSTAAQAQDGALTSPKDLYSSGTIGGGELDYGLKDEKVFPSLKAEVGRTFGAQTNPTTFLFAPGLKVKF